MKKIFVFIPLLTLGLTSCMKTAELYPNDAYCHTEFDLNYYTEWNNVDKLKINNETVKTVAPSSISGLSDDAIKLGENHKLSSYDSSFAYGYLSKLYDGRVSCGGLYQKSRVQLNKTGYATFFPKQLKTFESFCFALRGGTTCETPVKSSLPVDYELSFYIHITGSDSYDKVTYKMNNLMTITDHGGDTYLFSFNLEDVKDAVAMSLTYRLKDTTHPNLTDDYEDADKDHFAIMLYEVLLPNSQWY